MSDEYWQRQDKKAIFPDILWNTPEQKTKAGKLAIIGGNSNSFRTVAEATATAVHLGVGTVTTILPSSLKSKVPHAPGLAFAEAANAGSFSSKSFDSLFAAINDSNLTLLAGDLSRNSETTELISKLIASSVAPIVATRDAVDTFSTNPSLLAREGITIVATMPQLQSLFKAVHYPRPLLLSQPLMPVVETLHKFTTSYPITIATLHSEQIIVTNDGKITTTPLASTDYTPISLMSGTYATTIATLLLWNSSKPLEATTTAALYHPATE